MGAIRIGALVCVADEWPSSSTTRSFPAAGFPAAGLQNELDDREPVYGSQLDNLQWRDAAADFGC